MRIDEKKEKYRIDETRSRYECVECQISSGMTRRLFCGHAIDDKCLEKKFS